MYYSAADNGEGVYFCSKMARKTGFFSQFGPKLKGIKTQAFQKLNKKLSKLKDFVISKLNFSEKLRSLDARNEFLCSKKQINSGRNSTKQENSRKNSKTQGNYGVKTQENCQNSNFRKIH